MISIETVPMIIRKEARKTNGSCISDWTASWVYPRSSFAWWFCLNYFGGHLDDNEEGDNNSVILSSPLLHLAPICCHIDLKFFPVCLIINFFSWSPILSGCWWQLSTWWSRNMLKLMCSLFWRCVWLSLGFRSCSYTRVEGQCWGWCIPVCSEFRARRVNLEMYKFQQCQMNPRVLDIEVLTCASTSDHS